MALEQVRLAGGKRLEVNTYENCKQTAYRRLRKQSRVENEKMGQQNFWRQKLTKWFSFWGQKLYFMCEWNYIVMREV